MGALPSPVAGNHSQKCHWFIVGSSDVAYSFSSNDISSEIDGCWGIAEADTYTLTMANTNNTDETNKTFISSRRHKNTRWMLEYEEETIIHPYP